MCAMCRGAIEPQPIAEASRPWRHVDPEGDARAWSCEGATLIAWSALVRVDGEPASDAPWSTFVEENRNAGLDLESVRDIEEALSREGEYVGHHDADVGLVSHLDRRDVETLVDEEAIEHVLAFVADFWHRGDPSEAEEVEVRRFAVETILEGLAEGNVTRDALPSLFRSGCREWRDVAKTGGAEPDVITIAGVRLVRDDETATQNKPWWRGADSSAWRYSRPEDYYFGSVGCSLRFHGVECGGVEKTIEALSARVEAQLQSGRRALIERSKLDGLDMLAIANRLLVDGHEEAAAAVMRAAVLS